MKTNLTELLSEHKISPVLVDVGASERPPAIWNDIAACSTYVGFDPDEREMHEDKLAGFQRKVTVNMAVTADASATAVEFFLTKSPFCSSTKVPNAPALASYLYADLFVVEKTTQVGALTLNAAARLAKVATFDWLKLDTQGTDLSIFKSLNDALGKSVLALDIEPGLRDAYVDEDLFGDAHIHLTDNGFWPASIKTLGAIRMTDKAFDDLTRGMSPMAKKITEASLQRSPCWCEARYLRSLEWMEATGAGSREYRSPQR